ncbi:MAG: hypothetical protein IPJ74_01145 [Saprospiraceae bacterium]|nr:hypothetical protein [Saprospiraceae bacterium]
MKKEIRSLDALYLEKQKLQMQMEVTQDALLQSLDKSGHLVRDFLWSRVAIPAAVVGATTKGVQHLFSSNGNGKSKKRPAHAESNGKSRHWLRKALPIALAVAEAFIDTSEEEND